MIDSRSFMLSRFINGVLRRRPGMPGLAQLIGGTLSSGHRPLVHFQVAMGGTVWVATDGFRVLGFLTAMSVLGYGIVAGELRFNLTPSMPLGIYRLLPVPISAVARGMTVAVCAPTGASALGRSRGYLSIGRCPSVTEPLLKVIAGVTGDDVTVSARGVAIGGCLLANSRPFSRDLAGRRLKPWLSGRYRLHRGQLWLYANNERSWDSRYWVLRPLPSSWRGRFQSSDTAQILLGRGTLLWRIR